MAVFEGKKSSNYIINNDTISEDEVVASYVPPWNLVQSVSLFFRQSIDLLFYREIPSNNDFQILT